MATNITDEIHKLKDVTYNNKNLKTRKISNKVQIMISVKNLTLSILNQRDLAHSGVETRLNLKTNYTINKHFPF